MHDQAIHPRALVDKSDDLTCVLGREQDVARTGISDNVVERKAQDGDEGVRQLGRRRPRIADRNARFESTGLVALGVRP